jgi:hypothetical protein
MYRNQGRWAEAVKLQEDVLVASTRPLGKEHPDTLLAMENLAITYRRQGRLESAAKLEEKVLEAKNRLLVE